MEKAFLQAEWRKLLMINYKVDPGLLKMYLPYSTELDDFNGQHFVSVVGFLFKNTKLKGMKIPGYVNFEEVNLRFYVKRKVANEWVRGVVFIKEIVPKRMISFIANSVYYENYVTYKMSHLFSQDKDAFHVSYAWWNKFSHNRITAKCELFSKEIAIGSEEEFITEHYWGFTKINASKTSAYEVLHPRWLHYPVIDYQIEIDFAAVYGIDFSILHQQNAHSVLLAEGSEIRVQPHSIIR